MLLRIDQLASHVAAHAGVSPPLADYVLRAVVAGFGAYLSPAHRQLIADELPVPLSAALRTSSDERRPIEDRVQLAGMSPAQRTEVIASVCKVLAEELSDEALAVLRAALPANVASMFVPSAPEVEHAPSPLHRQASTVAEPNPHGEIKLSSGKRRQVDKPN